MMSRESCMGRVLLRRGQTAVRRWSIFMLKARIEMASSGRVKSVRATLCHIFSYYIQYMYAERFI